MISMMSPPKKKELIKSSSYHKHEGYEQIDNNDIYNDMINCFSLSIYSFSHTPLLFLL